MPGGARRTASACAPQYFKRRTSYFLVRARSTTTWSEVGLAGGSSQAIRHTHAHESDVFVWSTCARAVLTATERMEGMERRNRLMMAPGTASTAGLALFRVGLDRPIKVEPAQTPGIKCEDGPSNFPTVKPDRRGAGGTSHGEAAGKAGAGGHGIWRVAWKPRQVEWHVQPFPCLALTYRYFAT